MADFLGKKIVKTIKNLENKTKLICTFAGTALAVILYYLITSDYTCLYVLPLLMFAAAVIYGLKEPEENIFFLCFLVCFFTFLLGRRFLQRITGDSGSDFSAAIEVHTDLCLSIALLGLLLGYAGIDQLGHSKNLSGKQGTVSVQSRQSDMGAFCKVMFFLTYCFWMWNLLDIVFFVMKNGYSAYYLSYSSQVPRLVQIAGSLAPAFYFIFLSAMPTRKESIVPTILYCAYCVTSLATGRRLTFLAGMMIVAAYWLCRNRFAEQGKPWVSRKLLLGAGISIPILLMAMYLFEYIRSDSKVGNAADYFPLFGFFIRQGVSVNVIKYAELFEEQMNPDACYSLYSTLKWLKGNQLTELLQIEIPFAFGKQSMETAIFGTYLADFVSFYANEKNYLAGMGYGSSYVAELNADFGYLGVFLGSVLYGGTIGLTYKIAPKNGRSWLFAAGLYSADVMLTAPRASFDACFIKLLYVDFWMPVVLVMLYLRREKLRQLLTGWKKNRDKRA